jgi:predicted lipoprotein with Yx(FWY)xxD motif
MNMQILTRSNSNRYQLRLLAVALVAALGLVGAAVAMAGAKHSTTTATVSTRKISGLGVVLVNAKGRTLYAFMKDAQRRVTCTGSCASFWPPLKWKTMSKPTAGGAAKRALLSSDKNPSGGRVVTYNKWPLYTYSGDSAAGQAHGQAKNLNGGKWYVISPSGALIKHTASSGGGTTTGGGGGWG